MKFRCCLSGVEVVRDKVQKKMLLSHAVTTTHTYIHTFDTSPTSLASFAPKSRPVKHTFTRFTKDSQCRWIEEVGIVMKNTTLDGIDIPLSPSCPRQQSRIKYQYFDKGLEGLNASSRNSFGKR